MRIRKRGPVKVEVDETSSVIMCSTDELTVVQSDTNITATITRANTFDAPDDTCPPEDVLHSTLGQMRVWYQQGEILTRSPDGSIYMNTSGLNWSF